MLRGDDVAELQRRLNGLGFDAGREDGILGDDTTRALVEFQRNMDLPTDGICGASTISVLDRVGTLAEGSVASVREREVLRRGPHRLSGRRVFVAAAPGFETLARTVVRELDEIGAGAALDATGADDPILAAEANRYAADLFLAFRAGDASGLPVQLLRVGPLPVRGRVRGRRRGEPRARPHPRWRAVRRRSHLRGAPRDPHGRGDLRTGRRGRRRRHARRSCCGGPTWPTPSCAACGAASSSPPPPSRAVPPTRLLARARRSARGAGDVRGRGPGRPAVGHQPVDPLEVLEGRELDHDLAPRRCPSRS